MPAVFRVSRSGESTPKNFWGFGEFGKFGKFANVQCYFEFPAAGNSMENGPKMAGNRAINSKFPAVFRISRSGSSTAKNCCKFGKFGKFGKFANFQRYFEFPAAGNYTGNGLRWMEIELGIANF